MSRNRYEETVVVYEQGGKHMVKFADGKTLEVEGPVGRKVKVNSPRPFVVIEHFGQIWLVRNDVVVLRQQLAEMKSRCKAIGQIEDVITKRTHDGLVTKSSEMETSISHIASAAYTRKLADLLEDKIKSMSVPDVPGQGLTLIAPVISWDDHNVVFANIDYEKLKKAA